MKDLPHHMQKLNRRIIRSEHRLIETEMEEVEELAHPPHIERPREQNRKQIKSEMRKKTLAEIPIHATTDERNRKEKTRTPIFDRLSHPRPKVGAKPKKKAPRY